MRPSPTLLCVALLCASGLAWSAEARELGPEGDGSCPETAAAGNDPADVEEGDASPVAARRTQKARPAPSVRSGGNGAGSPRNTVPRWHSFLPGMIR